MVRLNQILNRMIIQCDDGCTYLNSSFNSTNVTVIYKGGSRIGFGQKNLLEDECEVIVISMLDNQLLIAISRYCERENSFDTYFVQKVDLESDLNLELDVSKQQLLVIKSIIERKFRCYCHCHANVLQEM